MHLALSTTLFLRVHSDHIRFSKAVCSKQTRCITGVQGLQLALAQARQCLAVTDSRADEDVQKPIFPDTGPEEA